MTATRRGFGAGRRLLPALIASVAVSTLGFAQAGVSAAASQGADTSRPSGSSTPAHSTTTPKSPRKATTAATASPVSHTILIYGPTLNGYPNNEETLAQAAGYTVTVADAATWSSMTSAQFASYSAIVFGDPTCSSDPSILNAAIANQSTWASVVSGPVVVIGTDPIYHQSQAGAQADQLTSNAIVTAASGTSTGMYASLSCYYASGAANTPVPLLAPFGNFTVQSDITGCDSSVHIVLSSDPVVAGITDSGLGGWGCSVHESFNSLPPAFTPVVVDTDFSPALPYIATALAPTFNPVGGPLTSSETYGGGDPSSACGCTAGGASAQPTVAGPINTATGDEVISATDLQVPGAGPALQLTRTYDAQLAQFQRSTGMPAGPLGFGWSSNLGMSLSFDATAQTATITQENGATVAFTAAGSSPPAWCPAGAAFCPTAPRVLASLSRNTDGTWTLARLVKGSNSFTFSAAGALVDIADAAGNHVSATTGTPGSGLCPASATSCTVWTSSASARSLALAFDAAGRLSSGTASGGQQATLCYWGDACAPSKSGGAVGLYSATDPGALTTTYSYDSGNAAAQLRSDITVETMPSGQTESNTYDGSGRVTQQVGSFGTVTLAYAGDQASVSGGTTTVTVYPVGQSGTGVPPQVTTYQYSSGVLLAETTGAGTVGASTMLFGRDPVSLVNAQVLDANGNLSTATLSTYSSAGGTPYSSANATLRTDGAGNTTETQFTGFNLPWCQVSAAEHADGVVCPSAQPASPPAPGAADPWPGAAISFYDSAQHLVAQTDATGATTVHAFTPAGLGVPAGLEYCSVDAVSYQAGVTCPAYGAAHVAGTTTTTFDAAGDALTSTDADGNVTTSAYGDAAHPWLPTSTRDADGGTTSFVYNAQGQPISQTVSFRSYTAVTRYAYDSAGRRFCEVSPLESAAGVVCPGAPKSQPTAGATNTTYDAAGRVILTVDPTGATTQYAYDQGGQRFCTVGPDAYAKRVRCPSSPPASAPTLASDPYLGATIDSFDSHGRVVQETNPLGGITLSSYDPAGNKQLQTVESGNASAAPDVVTAYTYDGDNRPLSQTVAGGTALATTASKAYNPNGHVYCEVSGNATAAGDRCPAWQAAWIASPPNPASLYGSGGAATGVQTSFYDPAGRLLQRSNPDAASTVNAYDADGRAYCSAPPIDATTWLAANPTATYPYLCPASPPSTAPAPGSNPGYETRIHDPAGRVLSDTDPTGNTTATTYDGDGNALTVTDAAGHTTTNCYYWQASACASAAPAGGGAASALYSTSTPPTAAAPSGITTTLTYAAGGLTATSQTAAGTQTTAYDEDGRPLTISWSAAPAGYAHTPTVQYTYWPAGERKTMTDGSGKTSYTYDGLGDLLSVALKPGKGSTAGAYQLAYSWFASGARHTVQYPATATVKAPAVTYTYNAAGNMASLTDWNSQTSSFGYDQDGNATSTVLPNGTTESAAFDLGGTATSAGIAPTSAPGSPLATITYQPNAADMVGSEADSGALSGSFTYGYDGAARLSSSNGATQAYDGAGNPTTLAGGTTQVFDAANEVTSSGTTGFSYDAAGDRTAATPASGPATAYGYDQGAHLVSIGSTSTTTTSTYDGDGLLATATAAGAAQTFVHDASQGTGTPVILTDGGNDYVYGPSSTLLEVISGATTRYALDDYLHTPRLLTDTSGAVVGTATYNPTGSLASRTGVSVAIGFAGGYSTDGVLVSFTHRWYDTATAQFLTRDPLVSRTRQPYLYASDDFVNASDPSGLCDWWNVVCDAGEAAGWVNDNVVQPVVNTVESGVQDLVNLALGPIFDTVQSFISDVADEAQSPWISSAAASASACDPSQGAPAQLTGQDAIAGIASVLRLPDYVALEVSGGDFGLVGGGVATLSRYGSVYVGPEGGFGVPGIVGTLEAGWIDEVGSVPGRDELNGFISNLSIAVSGYVPWPWDIAGVAAAEVWGNVGSFGNTDFATQVGIGVGEGKTVALVASWSFHVSDSGPTW